MLCVVALAVTACGAPAGRQPVTTRVAVTSSTAPLLDDVLRAYRRAAPNVAFEITRGNAETVATALDEGQVDWGLVSYLPADSDLWSAPLGTDALVMIVHPANPISGLTRGQVRAIFQGHAHNWEEFGGSDAPIVAVSRESGSAARGAFDELVMDSLPTTLAARRATNGEAALVYVAQDPGAIGYVSLGLVDERVRPLAVDGVSPSQDTARSGSYPLVSTVRFVAVQEPEHAAGDLLGWLLDDEGQAIVARHFAPLVR